MESGTNSNLNATFNKIVGMLKSMSSGFEIKSINVELCLHDTKNNKDINLKHSEKSNMLQMGGLLTDSEMLKSISSDNTLSTSIFRSINNNEDTEDLQSEYMLKGGFVNSSTSELNTTMKKTYDFSTTSMSETSMSATSLNSVPMRGGGMLSETSLSATSLNSVPMRGGVLSETSLSATSLNSVPMRGGGMLSETSLSATSLNSVPMRGGMLSETSMSETSLNSVPMRGGMLSETSMSATSLNSVPMRGGMLSETSLNSVPMRGGVSHKNKKQTHTTNNIQLNKMDTIRQKIKELDGSADMNIFKKNNQSGGANKNFAKIKQEIGINSSSTSSLCE